VGENKYIVYKVSGGLNHMLGQINNIIHLSKISNRLLIIDCNGGAFENDFNKYFNIPDINYSTNYDWLYNDSSLDKNMFEKYIKSNIRYIEKGTYFLENKKVSLNFNEVLNSNDKILYLTRVNTIKTKWHIKVNKNIVDEISKKKIKEKYVGVHFRNTDIKNDINKFISEILKLPEIYNIIYFATDDYNAIYKLKDLTKKFKIIQYTNPLNTKGHNIHYNNPNKDEVIMNALIDMYHLTYSSHFIPSIESSFSKRIIEIRKNDDFFK